MLHPKGLAGSFQYRKGSLQHIHLKSLQLCSKILQGIEYIQAQLLLKMSCRMMKGNILFGRVASECFLLSNQTLQYKFVLL